MDPLGVKWDDDAAEGAETGGGGGEKLKNSGNGVRADQRDTSKVTRKGTLRERAKRRVKSLSMNGSETESGWKFWSVRGKTKSRANLVEDDNTDASDRRTAEDALQELSKIASAPLRDDKSPEGRQAQERNAKEPWSQKGYRRFMSDAESWHDDLGGTDPKNKGKGKTVDYSARNAPTETGPPFPVSAASTVAQKDAVGLNSNGAGTSNSRSNTEASNKG